MSNQWVPPGMRRCTWDEAKRMNEGGGLREGIVSGHGQSTGWQEQTTNVTWLCIDTTKTQHTHADKPWVALGFEKCERAEASKDLGGGRLGWEDGTWTRGNPSHDGVVYLKPSPLLGLKLALEMLGDQHPDRWMLEAEIAKYEPPVCGECGRVK